MRLGWHYQLNHGPNLPRVPMPLNQGTPMTYLTISLFAYILGHLIKARINPPAGETIQTIAAISYVSLQLLVWLGVL